MTRAVGETVGIETEAETLAAKTEESEGRLMDLVFRNVMVRFCLTWGVGVLMSKVIARWSEMVRSMLVRLLMVMPAVQTRSSVCPFLWVGKSTC